jgi:two-component system chemotaxis response regulator CheB
MNIQDTPVRVAIVDDSRSVRRWLRIVLDADERLEVVAEAENCRQARDILRQIPVDVLTLDIDMPEMSGIEFLSRLMAYRPMPVVMLSALTEDGSNEAIEALSLGAVDCIEKPRSTLSDDMMRDIRDRVCFAAQTRVDVRNRANPADYGVRKFTSASPWKGPVVLLGASTGGVAALEQVLSEVEDTQWPIVIAQHMPQHFLRGFARRLSDQFSRRFVMARDGLVLQEGMAVLAAEGDVSTRLSQSVDGVISVEFVPPLPGAKYSPSIDDVFHSAAQTGLNGCAALLTGMGADGAQGLLALRKAGFHTWAQSEGSCVVYGMPRSAVELGAAAQVDDPIAIGKSIVSQMTNLSSSARMAEGL